MQNTPVSSGSGRMVTRVSSGAIRQKSVGELLGERDVRSVTFATDCFSSRTRAPHHGQTKWFAIHPQWMHYSKICPRRRSRYQTLHQIDHVERSFKTLLLSIHCQIRSIWIGSKQRPRLVPLSISCSELINRCRQRIGQRRSVRRIPWQFITE